jgi:hypothetical protein
MIADLKSAQNFDQGFHKFTQFLSLYKLLGKSVLRRFYFLECEILKI